jgi:hypothetical protein
MVLLLASSSCRCIATTTTTKERSPAPLLHCTNRILAMEKGGRPRPVCLVARETNPPTGCRTPNRLGPRRCETKILVAPSSDRTTFGPRRLDPAFFSTNVPPSFLLALRFFRRTFYRQGLVCFFSEFVSSIALPDMSSDQLLVLSSPADFFLFGRLFVVDCWEDSRNNGSLVRFATAWFFLFSDERRMMLDAAMPGPSGGYVSSGPVNEQLVSASKRY